MDGDRVILLWLNAKDEIVEQSARLYVGDNTIEDLIEQFDEMLAERKEGIENATDQSDGILY